MEIPNKPELAFTNSSEIDFKRFMNPYKKCTSKPYSFLFTNTSFASDNSSPFSKNILERI